MDSNTQKTGLEEFYDIIEEKGAGTLFYLVKKPIQQPDKEEYAFESVIIDPKNKDLTLRILKRVMDRPDFVAFPGTPEFFKIVSETSE